MRLPLFDMHLMTKIRAQVQNLSFGKNGQTANNQRARAQSLIPAQVSNIEQFPILFDIFNSL